MIKLLTLVLASLSTLPATTKNITFYVNGTTGNDLYSCLSTTVPCKTIQAAVDRVPKRVRHAVTLSIANGVYTGALLDGFTFENGGQVIVTSTSALPNATVATGTAIGTASSVSLGSGTNTWSTLTDTTQTWTTDDLRGKLIEITSGTCAGIIQAIYGNSATVITIAWPGSFELAWGYNEAQPAGCTPDATSTYAIRDWGVTINAAPTSPPGQISGIVLRNIAGPSVFSVTGATSRSLPSVIVQKLKFTSSAAVELRAASGVTVKYCRVQGGTLGGILFYGASHGAVVSTTASMTAGSTSFVAAGSTNAGLSSWISMYGNVQDGPGSFFGHAGTGGGAYAEGTFIFLGNSSKNAAPSLAAVKIEHCIGECAFYGDKIEGSTVHGIAFGQPSSEYSSGGGQVRIHGLTVDGFANVGILAIGPWNIIPDNTATDAILGTGTGASSAGIQLARGAKFTMPNASNTLAGNGGAVMLDYVGDNGNIGTYLSYSTIATNVTVCTQNQTCIRDYGGSSGALDRIEHLLGIFPSSVLGVGTYGQMQYDFSYLIRSVSVYVSSPSGGGAGSTTIRIVNGSNNCDCLLPCSGGANIGTNAIGIVKATCAGAGGDGCKMGFQKPNLISVPTGGNGCTTTQPTAQGNIYGNPM